MTLLPALYSPKIVLWFKIIVIEHRNVGKIIEYLVTITLCHKRGKNLLHLCREKAINILTYLIKEVSVTNTISNEKFNRLYILMVRTVVSFFR